MVEIIWKCNLCGSVQTAKSYEHHTMSYCDCKKSYVDLERTYRRQTMNIEILDKVYNVRDIVFNGLEIFKDISREEYMNKKVIFVE